jgi:putative FmdB family regulatory protein
VPTYQYACTECGHAFEQFQSFTDDALTSCPACEGRLRKVFNAVGVVFKGSGFYKTDSRNESKPAASSTSKADGDAGAKDGGSTSSTEKAGSASSSASSSGSSSGSSSAKDSSAA